MLINFSFCNFKSFRDEQAFSMEREKRYISDANQSNISSVSAIYGANASGKSNFLAALNTMMQMVQQSYSQGTATTLLPFQPFRLSTDTLNEPTEFFIEFIASDGQKYQYSFAYTSTAIVQEQLSRFSYLKNHFSSRPTLLFEREDQEIHFGPSFTQLRKLVAEMISSRPNALILSACAAINIELTRAVLEFFNSGGYYQASLFQNESPNIIVEFLNNTAAAQGLSKLIKYADFGIDGINVKKVEPAQLPTGITEAFTDIFGADQAKVQELFNSSNTVSMRFEHTGEGTNTELDITEESLGTQAALAFFSVALRNLTKNSLVLIDEIDTSLHPLLVKQFVELFTDPETNPHGSQLIFTSHDTSLVNVSSSEDHVLQPDQIWFAEKNTDGSSDIYPATDMKLRKGENIGKNYLHGVYGAIPRPTFHDVFAQIIEESSNDK